MKNIFLFIIPLIYITDCFAQETVERKNRLTDSVIEKYYVLKSDKKTKDGPYQALFQRKTVIASGNYSKDKKTGTWRFFDTSGKLAESYDYDTNKFTYEAPLYATDDISYLFDEQLKKTDKVTRPYKIGGIYYGYIPYVSIFRLPFDTYGINTEAFDADVELLISPMGRLAEYKVRIISSQYNYDHTVSLDVHLFDEADRKFVPATLNDKPILSRIIIRCYITNNGGLDFY